MTPEEAFADLLEAWDELSIDVRLHARLPEYAVTVECFKPSYQQRFHGASLEAALIKATDWLERFPNERTYKSAEVGRP